MTVVCRFAPSPTGFLHIGGARTALFNWLFARHHGGKYLLRIEDTDRKRSTKEAIDAILDGLDWLGLDHDGEVVYQSHRAEAHAAAALRLLDEGKAYRCYASQEELEEMRATARAEGRPMRYDGRWRDRDPSEAPEGVDPVIRLKMPQSGETAIQDGVQGEVTVGNEQLDDMVLMRGDGSPTYMLSVVVDDHDMGITHVLRGDDHLTNAFRQHQLYKALDWKPPIFAHVPLIHGPDGAKLSKRHGALGVETYREMGYLPEALRNYLLRLGWGHGDDEVFSTEQAIEWFDFDGIGRSPARFDFAKLDHLNGHYLREADDARLADLVSARLGGTDDAGHHRICSISGRRHLQRIHACPHLDRHAGRLQAAFKLPGRLRIGHHRLPRPVRQTLPVQRLDAGAGGQAVDDESTRIGRRHRQHALADRTGRAEYAQPLHRHASAPVISTKVGAAASNPSIRSSTPP